MMSVKFLGLPVTLAAAYVAYKLWLDKRNSRQKVVERLRTDLFRTGLQLIKQGQVRAGIKCVSVSLSHFGEPQALLDLLEKVLSPVEYKTLTERIMFLDRRLRTEAEFIRFARRVYAECGAACNGE